MLSVYGCVVRIPGMILDTAPGASRHQKRRSHWAPRSTTQKTFYYKKLSCSALGQEQNIPPSSPFLPSHRRDQSRVLVNTVTLSILRPWPSKGPWRPGSESPTWASPATIIPPRVLLNSQNGPVSFLQSRVVFPTRRPGKQRHNLFSFGNKTVIMKAKPNHSVRQLLGILSGSERGRCHQQFS